MSSEKDNGIMEQPENTCPLIDSVISDLESALDDLEGWRHMNEEELREACDNAEWRISHADLEPIRHHVTQVREWGQQWKDLAKELKQDIHKGQV